MRIAELRASLLDDFSHQVLTGALRVATDKGNPIRLNLFAAAIRELFGHILHILAPDSEVTNCSWYVQEPNTRGPTRRQRAKYATQGGLSDEFIAEAGVDIEHLHGDAIAAITQLNRYTHVRPGVTVTQSTDIECFVQEALSALQGLFTSFEMCREEVLQAIYSHIDQEIMGTFISDTLQEIDELATHHTVEDVYIEELTITELNDRTVGFNVEGSVEVELQWGSNSDSRRGDGASLRQHFPFVVKMSSPVDNIIAFTDIQYTIDTRQWYGGN